MSGSGTAPTPSAMKDKLSQLLVQDDDDHSTDDNIALQFVEEGDSSAFMQGFFSNVEDIRRAINVINQSIEKIKRNNSVMLETLSHEAEKRENEELSQQVKQLSQKVHSGLKRINQELQTEDSGPDRNTANHRIKKAQHVNLSRKFHEIMMEYSQVQEDYRDKTKVMIQRQLQITTGKRVNEDDVDEMIEKGNLQVFTQDILVSTAQQRQALNEVEQRHREIMALEQDIRELHEMFVDMSALVQEQGEVIDRIEHNVESAGQHVRKGREEVKQAAKLKSSTNRKKICIAGICIAIAVAILIIIAIIIAVTQS
ncbi:syntaxin-1A-like [Dysidea avara]|uniref:syntaxin-1A-like n=1 Tax=Dysidea avara TaxID=196820 RepID=UPI0033278A90